MQNKGSIFEQVAAQLAEAGFKVVKKDESRPWGGFFVIDEGQASAFIETYFPQLSVADFASFEKLSPKILVVAPHKRLSWQYHFRREEIWRVIGGTAGVVTSPTDVEGNLQHLAVGQVIKMAIGERHRLVGLEDWGIVAEIWQHTDPRNPSDEDDIVRLQDDFGR